MVNVILLVSRQLVRIQQPHRSDSNQCPSYIAIFSFFNFWSPKEKKFKILKVQSVENLCFQLSQDLDADHKQKEF